MALPKPPTCPDTHLKAYYPLDFASALPALALLACLPSGTGKVLDACAAPGGKCLLLAGTLLAAPGAMRMFATDFDNFRISRLRQNLRLYLPDVARSRISAIQGDACSPAPALRRAGPFNGALVDAPCSGEREALLGAASRRRSAAPVTVVEAMPGPLCPSVDTAEGLPWKQSIARAMAARQVRLLRAAIELCTPYATVVYATCALSEIENDGVVEEVLRHAPHGWHCHLGGITSDQASRSLDLGIVAIDAAAEIEDTRFGYRLLPDRGGYGPIYWSVLRGPLC